MNFDINVWLNNLSIISQKTINFLFGTKWSLVILIIIVVVYLVLNGKEKPKDNITLPTTNTQSLKIGSA